MRKAQKEIIMLSRTVFWELEVHFYNHVIDAGLKPIEVTFGYDFDRIGQAAYRKKE